MLYCSYAGFGIVGARQALKHPCTVWHTADYGPFGFSERFDPDYIPNTSDLPEGRYRFRWEAVRTTDGACMWHMHGEWSLVPCTRLPVRTEC